LQVQCIPGMHRRTSVDTTMKNAACTKVGLIGCVLCGLIAPAPAAERRAPDALARYVPGDAFVIFGYTSTPEREFVDQHWSRVYRALEASNIGRELHAAIALSIPEKDRAEFDATWQRMTDLFGAVQWCDLIANDLVFAERIVGLFPDWFFIMRPEAATLDHNEKALAAILQTVADLETGGKVTFSQKVAGGVSMSMLDVRDAPIGLCVMRKGEVLAVVVGRPGRDACRKLLAGETDIAQSMAGNARYRAALADVPAPQHIVSFVDLRQLFDVLPNFPKMVAGRVEERRKAEQRRQSGSNGDSGPQGQTRPVTPADLPQDAQDFFNFFAAFLDEVNIIDYIVTSGRMDGYQELTYSAVKPDPSAANKPLFKIVAGSRPLGKFQRYLPVETRSFTAFGGADLEGFYGWMLDFVRDKVPDGDQLYAKWAQVQEKIGFNVQSQLLGWLGAEVIIAEIPPAVPSPFGGGDAVLLWRVKERDRAREMLDRGLKRIDALANEYSPPFSLQPATQIPADGFLRINHFTTVAFQIQPCIGIWEDWLVMASSENAVRLMIETANGKHPNILENQRFRQEGLNVEGPVHYASFQDMSQFGQQMAALFMGLGFGVASIPDSPETRPIKAIMQTMSGLGPVVSEINFINSVYSVTEYRDDRWYTTSKTTYKPPTKTAASHPE
jgi:hypothetical protein